MDNQTILGRFPETPVVGYYDNVDIVKNILVRSGRCDSTSIITDCLAKMVWARICGRLVKIVTEEDLDVAVEQAQKSLSRIAGEPRAEEQT